MKKKYNKLTIIDENPKFKKNGYFYYKCKCECGNIKIISFYYLKYNRVKSCGCASARIKNESGKKFANLLVLDKYKRENGKTYWLCKCDCGNKKYISIADLKCGHIKSCGCLAIKRFKKMVTRHGKSKTPEYNVWKRMKGRCYNKNNPGYKYYGGS